MEERRGSRTERRRDARRIKEVKKERRKPDIVKSTRRAEPGGREKQGRREGREEKHS